jgi:hypothetical protein
MHCVRLNTHAMLTLLLTTDPDMFGLDAPGPALGGWCCFFHIKSLRCSNGEELFIVAHLPVPRWRWRYLFSHRHEIIFQWKRSTLWTARHCLDHYSTPPQYLAQCHKKSHIFSPFAKENNRAAWMERDWVFPLKGKINFRTLLKSKTNRGNIC